MIPGRPRRGTRERSWGVDEGDGGIAVASGVVAGNRLIRRMLDRDDARERIHAEQGDEPRRLPARVWRVRERHVVLPGVQVFRERQGVHAMDHRPVIHLEEGDVGLERRQREPVDLDEVRAHGPARERFETERARAREQVEDARTTQRALENGEPRLAHAVPGGPHGVARRSLETAALEVAGDDADHALPLHPLPIADYGFRTADFAHDLPLQIRNPQSAIRNFHVLGAIAATRACSVVRPCHSSRSRRKATSSRSASQWSGIASAHWNAIAGSTPDASSSVKRRWFVPTRRAPTARAWRTPNTGAGLPGPHGSR